MGAVIPQVITESRASGAPIVDGSVTLNGSEYFEWYPTADGNRNTWTYSVWFKIDNDTLNFDPFNAGASASSMTGVALRRGGIGDENKFNWTNQSGGGVQLNRVSSQLFRDYTGWTHFVWVFDLWNPSQSERTRMYLNGEKIRDFSTNNNSLSPTSAGREVNRQNVVHYFGRDPASQFGYAKMSQLHFIDGQALDPCNFGFHDPLTNTWRPKKYTGSTNDTTYPNNINRNFSSSLLPSNAFNASYPAYNAFDGGFESFASGDGGSQYLELGSSFEGVTSLRIQCAAGSGFNMGGETYTISGTGITSKVISTDSEAKSLTSISITSTTISGIRVTSSSGLQPRFVAIEINGIILKDNAGWGLNGLYVPLDGNTPLGEDQSGVGPNDGTRWSDGKSAETGSANNPIHRSFDGSLSTYGMTANSNGDSSNLVVSLSGLPANKTVRFYGFKNTNAGTLTFNGGAVSLPSGTTAEWVTAVQKTNGSTDSYSMNVNPGSSISDDLAVYAVEVDGTILKDDQISNSITPVKINGGNTIDKATGALPILNTDGGGKTLIPGVRSETLTAVNDGTRWSDGGDSNWDSSYPIANGFNGISEYTGSFIGMARPNNANVTATWNAPGSGIPFSTLKLRAARDSGGNYSNAIKINDVDVTSQFTASTTTLETVTITGVTSPLTKLELTAQSGVAQPRFTAIYIDDTQLQDDAGCILALPLAGDTKDVSGKLREPIPDKTLTRLRFKTDWNWMYVSAIEINDTILTTGTLDNSGSVWTDPDKWKNGNTGSGQETYSQSARGDYFDVTLASTIEFEKLRIFLYLDSSAGSTTHTFELELFFQDGSTLTKVFPSMLDAPNQTPHQFNSRQWQDFGDVREKYVRAVGNAAYSSITSNFYNNSFAFDGTGDYLTTPDDEDYNLAGGDWTIEAFVYHSSTNYTSYEGIIGQWTDSSTGSFVFETVGSGATSDLEFYYYDDSNNFVGPLQGPALQKEKWQHVAACRSGDTIRLFVDGVMYGTGTPISVDIKNSSDPVTIGGHVATSSGGGYWNGNIQDVRIYKGVAKYTKNFIPASTSSDILPHTPSSVPSSALDFVSEGAVAFDGTGDYLSTNSSSSDLALGIVDYTIECYVYMTAASSAEDGIFQISATSGGLAATQTNTLTLQTNSGVYRSYANDTSTPFSTAVITNQWVHLALVRKNESLNLFVNGVKDATTISDSRNYSGGYIAIGGYYSTSYLWNGFISNFRVVNGTALYTENFTPPAAPLTNVTNTKLLCCQSNASAGAAVVAPNISGVNDGTVWSSSGSDTNGLISSGGIETLFNGDDSSYIGVVKSTDTYVIALDNQSISCSSQISLRTYDGASTPTMRVTNTSGSTSTFTVTSGSSLSWYDFSYSGTIKKIEIGYIGGSGSSTQFAGFKVDGTVLKDPVTKNGDVAATNFNPFNTDINTVRGGSANYATLNPLQQSPNNTPTISDGNLSLSRAASSAEWTNTGCTMSIPKSGKWFWEITWTAVGGGSVARCGVADSEDYEFHRNTSATGLPWLGSGTGTSWSCDVRGYVYNGGTETTGYLSAFAAGDVMGILLDRDNNTITYTRNGVSGGVAHSNVTPDFVTPGFGLHASTTNSFDVNFGQRPFKFPPPAGYNSLNTSHRTDSVLTADRYFGVSSYIGNNSVLHSYNPWSSGCDLANPHLMYNGDLTGLSGGQVVPDGEKTILVAPYDIKIDTVRIYHTFAGIPFDLRIGDKFYHVVTVAGTDHNDFDYYGILRKGQEIHIHNTSGSFSSYVRGIEFNGTSGDVLLDGCGEFKFQPDLVWIKQRNSGGGTNDHVLVDSVRGRSKSLYPSGTYAENTSDSDKDLISFNVNGFTLGPTQQSAVNRGSDYNYVAWCWKAGGNKGTFNVDDKGYASASDVNMAVGDLNDVSYNQTQTWSTYGTVTGTFSPAIGNLFNGSLSDGPSASAGTSPDFQFTSGIPFTKVEFYSSNGSGSGYDNGGANPDAYFAFLSGGVWNIANGVGSRWIDITNILQGNTLDGVKINVPGGWGSGGLRALKIDGKLLVDNGTSVDDVPSLAPTACSVGTKQGFSIIKADPSQSAHTIPHGLGKPPAFIISKPSTSGSLDWNVYHKSMGENNFIRFTTAAQQNVSGYWGTGLITSTTFGVAAGNNGNNQSTPLYYCWAEIPGYSKFGEYLSEGGTDANYVYLGFKPALLMIKSKVHVADTTSWCMYTSDLYNNPYPSPLYANNAAAEGLRGNNSNTGTFDVDILSDGFKLRTNVGEVNEGGASDYYMYAAWAETPNVNVFGAQSNAR